MTKVAWLCDVALLDSKVWCIVAVGGGLKLETGDPAGTLGDGVLISLGS